MQTFRNIRTGSETTVSEDHPFFPAFVANVADGRFEQVEPSEAEVTQEPGNDVPSNTETEEGEEGS